MSTRVKWAVSILVAASALFTILILLRAATPFESHVLSAKRIELTGWSSYWDGGSRSFAFELPSSRHMVIFVPQRHPEFGGNPDFQEIWLGPNKEGMHQVCLKPASALEARLLALLQTATVTTNTRASPTNWPWTPTPRELKWLAERIQDRKSKW